MGTKAYLRAVVVVAVLAGAIGSALTVAPEGTFGPKVVVPSAGLFTGVACSGALSCVAVGGSFQHPHRGVVTTLASGSPGTTRVVPGALLLNGIACPGATTCEAVGEAPSGMGVIESLH